MVHGFSSDLHPQARPYYAEAESAFIWGVYRWMTVGLALTGFAAVLTANSPLIEIVFTNPPLLWGLLIVELGLVFAVSGMAHRLSATAAGGLFLLYSAINGVTLASILIVYTAHSVATAFFVTAGTFGAMSAFGYYTKQDLTGMRSFLYMGLFGIIIASVVNFFLASTSLYWLITYAGVLVFVGLTAYDTQKLKDYAREHDGSGEGLAKLAVIGALMLYLDFINLFLMLLRILGNRRS